jgi:xanthine/uracil permease
MTYTEYVAILAGLDVTGVVKVYTAPPTQLSTAQLPAQWARLPQGETTIATLTGAAGLPSFTCDLVIAVEAMGQNTQPANYAKCLALIDALQTALTTEALENKVDSWTLRMDAEQIGETAYWTLVASVTGSE